MKKLFQLFDNNIFKIKAINTMQKIKLALICIMAHLLIDISGNAQARLVINGGIINLSNGANLVIDNPNSNAITRTSGHIISEGENNTVKWNVGTSTGNYIVPFGYGATDYLPISFSPSNANGNGSFLLSTYYGVSAINSSYLPSGVTHYNYAGNDHSTKGIDRFWQVNAIGYNAKPDISNLQLSYRDLEHNTLPNIITEGNLKAKRWNSMLGQWDDFSPASSINTVSNTVTIPSLSNSQHFAWWTLMNVSAPLPVEFLSFSGRCKGNDNELSWVTASEVNCDYFELQRSDDAIHFKTIERLKSKAIQGNSSASIQYEVIDENVLNPTSYYRLQQFDVDGNSHLSKVITLYQNQSTDNIQIYPNPSHGRFQVSIQESNLENLMLMIQDVKGQIVYEQAVSNPITNVQLNQSGVYLITVKGPSFTNTQKLIIQSN